MEVLHTLETIHTIESSLDEELSYHYLESFNKTSLDYHKYTFPEYNYEDIKNLINRYACFCASILDFKTNKSYTSPFPLQIFRYLMMSDGTWATYYSKYKDLGYVVEGAHWSNGLYYQVRQDKRHPFDVHQVVFYLDSNTRYTYNFP